jgi:hypothetical protein
VIAPPSATGTTHTICPTCFAAMFDHPPAERIAGPGVHDLDELRS